MMDPNDIFYLAMCGIILLIGVVSLRAFGGLSSIALILILLAAVMILALNWVDFVVFPLFTKMFSIIVQPAKDYTIVTSHDALLKNVGGLYYATGYVTGNLFSYAFKEETEEEGVESQMIQSADKWERAIMSLDFPFKFHVLSVGRDVQKIRDELEGKRSYQEFQLARALENEKASSETATIDIRRQIAVIQAKIDRISAGEKPVSTIMYFETTAVGVSEKAALDQLTTQIKQLQISMSALNLSLSRVAGRELYSLFKFNFSIPLTSDEISAEFSIEG